MFDGLPDFNLCFGRVMHRRLRPAGHRFHYGVGFLLFRLAALPEARSSVLFGWNRWRPLSWLARDHGAGDDAPEAWARARLRDAGIASADGDIWLQCFPRVAGYVFNPVSFWYCLDRAGQLQAVLAEVNNTFGERHVYLLSADAGPIVPGGTLSCRKLMQVSPFNRISGHYEFRLDWQAARLRVAIDYHDEAGLLLQTAVWGAPAPLNRAACARLLLAYPLMSFAIMARIHWHALLLLCKRVPFFGKNGYQTNEARP
ncbi:DUF1365 domain-containing protein [Chitinilyticum litopenaei]|uniref:DUF1365 domain-containing protein n=1 Tax=Chitinilyticum litopenaei TaxID=1121276 RepID=UPI000414A15C|nr:DUF1365 domain-containing protein [Chitinilyticum litopenaei]